MFRIRQYLKMLLQNVFLPLIYAWYARRPIEEGLVIFADAHHDEVPFSMRRMYEEVTRRAAKFQETRGREPESGRLEKSQEARGRKPEFENECRKASGRAAKPQEANGGEVRPQKASGRAPRLHIETFICDFNKLPYGQMVKYLLHFMKRYAAAEYVFICDYYLPVASCRKRPETTVVQLWHSCGLMKKIAYDAGDDIPAGYRGDMFGNYTWLTLSAEVCVPVHERALRLPADRIRATGVSRTDYYFDERWNDACRESFYRQYPEARGRKIALWAPTFRGNAAHPRLCGLADIRETAKALEPDWFFLIKAHPHIDAHGHVSNCTIPTEELLCVADVLITDYSSVMFDYLIYEKPLILFASDLQEYEGGRGFYIDYGAMPFPITENAGQLLQAVKDSADGAPEQKAAQRSALRKWKEQYVGACDGQATQRILDLIRFTEKYGESNR